MNTLKMIGWGILLTSFGAAIVLTVAAYMGAEVKRDHGEQVAAAAKVLRAPEDMTFHSTVVPRCVEPECTIKTEEWTPVTPTQDIRTSEQVFDALKRKAEVIDVENKKIAAQLEKAKDELARFKAGLQH